MPQELLCSPVYTDAQWHIRDDSHKQKKKGKGPALTGDDAAIPFLGWFCRMCLGSTGETELAAVLSQGTNNAVLGFVPESHMLSKLSEENT